MILSLGTGRSVHRFGLGILAAALAIAVSGCGTLPGGDAYQISKSLINLENKQDKYLEEQASSNRQIDYKLDSLEQHVQGNQEVLRTTIEDLEKRTRTQVEDTQRLRSEVERLSFAIDSLIRRLEIQHGLSPATSLAPTTSTAVTTPTPSGTSLSAGDSARASAIRQFNLGQYEAAREGFRTALELKPETPQKEVETLFWLAESCYKLKDLPAATTNFNRLIQVSPSDPKAWVALERLANIKLEQGDETQALKMLRYIETTNPQYENITRIRETINRLGGAPMEGQNLPTPPAGRAESASTSGTLPNP